MRQEVIDALKQFDWQQIIQRGNGLEDLNGRQFRFVKGLVGEMIVEKYSGPNGLKYVGEDHKDFDWPTLGISVELKSGFSSGMYRKNGELKKKITVKFNNSNGTNTKETLDPNEVADILLVIKNDGAFFIEKETVLARSKKTGDGFDVIIQKEDVIEITGKVTVNSINSLNLKEKLLDAIRQVI